jgi:hypothetical protein
MAMTRQRTIAPRNQRDKNAWIPLSATKREIESLQRSIAAALPTLETVLIDDLELSARSANALRRLNVRTVADLATLGAPKIEQIRSIGVTALRSIRTALSKALKGPAPPDLPPSLGDLWQDLAHAVQAPGADAARTLDIIVRRFGLLGGRPQTLPEIGQRHGLTKQRTSQIELYAIRRLRHPARRAFRAAVRLLRRQIARHGIAPVDAIISRSAKDMPATPEGMGRLVARAGGDFRLTSGRWIVAADGVPEDITRVLNASVKTLPEEISWDDAVAFVRSVLEASRLPADVAVGLLVAGTGRAVVIERDLASPSIALRHNGLSAKDAWRLALEEAQRPLAARDMGEISAARFQKTAFTKTSRYLRDSIQRDSRFVLVGDGVYDLADRLPIATAEQERLRDMAHAAVKSLGQPTDTLFLLENLSRDLPAATALNRYSLYWILKADRRFRLMRRFHVSLREWGKDASYTPVANAILKTLREAGRPLTDREIHGRLLVARTIRLYSISQCLARLAKRGQVVKITRATYAAASSGQTSLQKIGPADGDAS